MMMMMMISPDSGDYLNTNVIRPSSYLCMALIPIVTFL